METRPYPTAKILTEVCGGNQGLIGSMHHGLVETPMHRIYPVLDLDELVAFSASSWKSREKMQLAPELGKDAYGLFSAVYKIGFPWLNKHKLISEDSTEKYSQLNPFKGGFLRERLESVDPSAFEELKRKLTQPAKEWVFEIHYYDLERARGGNDYNLELMRFQNKYPKAGKIVPAFAEEIARMMKDYSREYEHPSHEVKKDQADLFFF